MFSFFRFQTQSGFVQTGHGVTTGNRAVLAFHLSIAVPACTLYAVLSASTAALTIWKYVESNFITFTPDEVVQNDNFF